MNPWFLAPALGLACLVAGCGPSQVGIRADRSTTQNTPTNMPIEKITKTDAEWQKLRAIPEYADKEIVSRITNKILSPTAFSEI